MSYTPENNPYIPGDPYSYDLKWIVAELKKLLKDYEPLTRAYENLEADFENLKEYVLNYFDSTDFQQLVSDKLDEMLADGELRDILEELIADLGTGIVYQYHSEAELNASNAAIGDFVIYNNKIYKIAASDNGFGIRTQNGYAINNFTELKNFNYDMCKVLKFYLFGLGSGYQLQGSCYAKKINSYAYYFVNSNDNTDNKFIIITSAGVINDYSISTAKGNDLCYIDSLDKFCLIYDYSSLGTYNFYLIDASGTITNMLYSPSDSWKCSNISYDSKHDRLISLVSGNFIAVMSPIIENDMFSLITTTPSIDADNATLPNSNTYTLRQGSCCDENGNFFMLSSIDYGDGFIKSGARIVQIDSTNGDIIAINDFLYPRRYVEAESCFIKNSQIHINGYDSYAVFEIIANIDCVNSKEDTIQNSIVYFSTSGKLINNGLDEAYPVNDLMLAISIAGSYENGIVYMQTDESSGQAGNLINLFFKKSLIISSDDSNYKRKIYSRFEGSNLAGNFKIAYAEIVRVSGTGLANTSNNLHIVDSNLNIVIDNCTLTGNGSGAGRYFSRLINAGTITLRNLTVNNSYCIVNISDGTRLAAYSLTGTTCNRIVDCDLGSIAVINTGYSTYVVSGFTNIGEQYGGTIIKATTGIITP